MLSRNSSASNSCRGSRSNWQFVVSSSTPPQYTMPASANARRRRSLPNQPPSAGGRPVIWTSAANPASMRKPGKFSANVCLRDASETAPLRASAAMRKSANIAPTSKRR